MSDKQYDNRGKGALWLSAWWSKDNLTTPQYTGYLVADRAISEGEEIKLAVYFNERKNPDDKHDTKPNLNIRIDRRERRQGSNEGTFKPKGYSREQAEADVKAKYGPGAYIDRDKTAKRMAEVKAKPAVDPDFDDDISRIPF